MILKERHPLTGQPLVRETRGISTPYPYAALPRQPFGDFIKAGQSWVADWLQYQDLTVTRVRCWKCGTDIKGWRMALDHKGNPITVNDQPAVTFGLLNHFTQTPMAVYLKGLDRVATFSVLHCADCVIRSENAQDAATCYLQGLDHGLRQAWRFDQGQQLTTDQWASFLYLWHQAEPVGVERSMTDDLAQINQQILKLKRQAKGALRVPVPGEILTAAHYAHDVMMGQFSGVPTGTIVECVGDPPAGWVRLTGQSVDPQEYPALAKRMPVLPNDPKKMVKT